METSRVEIALQPPRSAPRRPRSGIALLLVICLVLVLAVFGGILRVLTHAAYVEVDLVSAHLRAIAVGELAFGAVVARLTATRWSDRWFRNEAEIVTEVAAGDGTYSYLLRDTPQPSVPTDPVLRAMAGSPHQADLMVRATFGRASVAMFWRLTVPEDSLDSLATVVPVYFGFPPEGTQPTPPDVDAFTPLVDAAIKEREKNDPRSSGLEGPIGHAQTPAEIGTLLGFDPGPGVLAGVTPPGGGPPVSHPPPPDFPPLLPVPPVPPIADLTGLWTSEYQDLPLGNGDPTLHHARDYLEIRTGGGKVRGKARFIDDDGLLITEWEFTTDDTPGRLQFVWNNLRTIIRGPNTPGDNRGVSLALDPTGNVLAGYYDQANGARAARYERVQ